MHLYLVRHADALEGANDDARPLSPKGVEQIQRVGDWLRVAGAVEVDEIWHSPLVRARDTAMRLAEQLKSRAKLRPMDDLRSEDDPEKILPRLNELRKPVMLVGHNPHVSFLATLLVTGRPSPAGFAFKKCAVLRLDREGGAWIVRWLISPELVK
jgi:phosphohistidine phosphatase